MNFLFLLSTNIRQNRNKNKISFLNFFIHKFRDLDYGLNARK